MASRRVVGVNERGRRVGESHPKARLTREDVDLILELVEERDRLRVELEQCAARRRELQRRTENVSLSRIAEKFGVGKSTIQHIVNCETWGQTPFRFKSVSERAENASSEARSGFGSKHTRPL